MSDLDYSVRIESLASGQGETFSPSDPDRLISVEECSTRMNIGFDAATMKLGRREELRFPTPRELQQVTIFGPGDRVIWQGRVNPIPKGTGKNAVTASGFYGAFSDDAGWGMVYRDADPSKWTAASLARKSNLIAAGYSPQDAETTPEGVRTKLAQPTWTAAALPHTEAWWFGPPGCVIGKVEYAWAKTAYVTAGPDNYGWTVSLSDDDVATHFQTTGDLQAAGPGSGTLASDGAYDYRHAVVQLYHSAAFGTDDSYDRSIGWTGLVVYGNHGLTNIYASEVLKHFIGAACPKLTYDSDSIQDTTYAISHLIADPSEPPERLIGKINAYHLWQIFVWEDRKVWYHPAKLLDDYDYMLDTGAGDTFQPSTQAQGDDLPVNGVDVIYNSVTTGREEVVLASSNTALQDTDESNPCNVEDYDRTAVIKIGFPVTETDAVQVGSTWLLENSMPTRSGQGSSGPYVLDRSGARVPAWNVRAGDRIRYRHSSDIFTVHQTRYSPITGQMDYTFEDAPLTFDGVIERMQMGQGQR